MILGGDSNIAFDQDLDKSKPPSTQHTRPTKGSSKIARLIFQHGLAEINPSKWNYTHFSSPHQSYARIDNILISSVHIPSVCKSYIKDTVLSNHSTFTEIFSMQTHLPFFYTSHSRGVSILIHKDHISLVRNWLGSEKEVFGIIVLGKHTHTLY